MGVQGIKSRHRLSLHDPSGAILQYNDPQYIAAMEARGRALLAAPVKQKIQAYSTANKSNSSVITVSAFLKNLARLVENKTNCTRSSDDTGCASFIDDAITNLPRNVGHGDMTSIFWGRPSSQNPKTNRNKQQLKANAIVWGQLTAWELLIRSCQA